MKTNSNNKETSTPPKDAYKSRSSKGKAIARVKRNFPCSPRKRTAIVKELSWEQIEIKPFAQPRKDLTHQYVQKKIRNRLYISLAEMIFLDKLQVNVIWSK